VLSPWLSACILLHRGNVNQKVAEGGVFGKNDVVSEADPEAAATHDRGKAVGEMSCVDIGAVERLAIVKGA
jgi:hypothetical protein